MGDKGDLKTLKIMKVLQCCYEEERERGGLQATHSLNFLSSLEYLGFFSISEGT